VDAKSPLRGAVSSANLRQSGRLGRARDLREGGLSKSSSMNFTNLRQEEVRTALCYWCFLLRLIIYDHSRTSLLLP
jgi:hypothetical protein